jgi:hypothetical protein
MSTKKILAGALLLIAIVAASWFLTQRNSGLGANSRIAGDLGAADAGGAELATYEGETDWDFLKENSELGQNLTEIFRGHFGDEIEKENPEWVQETREAFAKFEALQVKEARVEPELGVTTPTVFYRLLKTDGTKTEDEARELATYLPFAMILTFDADRTIHVKTANPEPPSTDLTKSFANTLVAIVNREDSKSSSGPLSSGE